MNIYTKLARYRTHARHMAQIALQHGVAPAVGECFVQTTDGHLNRRDFRQALSLMLQFSRKPVLPFPYGGFQPYTRQIRNEELQRYNYLREAS